MNFIYESVLQLRNYHVNEVGIVSVEFIIVVAIIFVLCATMFFTVEQQTFAVIERFGKFRKIATPGLNFKVPFVDRIRAKMSMRIHQLDVEVETKTQDNVFSTIIIAVQYKILEDKKYESFYMLQDPEQQIRSFVFDLVRAQVPLLPLDDVFSKKDDIADAILGELAAPMAEFGYQIIKALVTDINPDAHVKAAMNEINTAQRLRVAANERGEAEKILKVKQAEAEAEASILHGKGIAGQRKAVIEGLGQSVEEFVKSAGSTPDRVMDLVMLIQYIDTLKEIGGTSKSNVVFVPHSPGNLKSIEDQIRETIFASNLIKND